MDGAKLATAAQRKGDQAPSAVYHLARARDGASGAFSRGAAAAHHGDLSQGLIDADARRERKHALAARHGDLSQGLVDARARRERKRAQASTHRPACTHVSQHIFTPNARKP